MPNNLLNPLPDGVIRFMKTTDAAGIHTPHVNIDNIPEDGNLALIAGAISNGAMNTRIGTSGLLSASFLQTSGAVYSAQVKGTSGTLWACQFFNADILLPIFIRLYDKAGAPAAGDGASIIWRGVTPLLNSITLLFPGGLPFANGLGIRVSKAIADNDATGVVANTAMGNILYT